MIPLHGPHYEDLSAGQVLPRQPSVAIDDGMAALYQSMVGERLPMTLDPAVFEAVSGRPGRLASPALVMHLSIGHSTTLTRRVIANLFYREVRFLRPVVVGQSIATTVTVAALADSRPKPGRPHRGKVLVDIETTADGEPAITYRRAPMLPQAGDEQPGHDDDLGTSPPLELASYAALVPADWDFAPLGPGTDWQPGDTVEDPCREVVDNALGLVRLTNNLALVHRDAAASPYPERLLYGAHVVGLAQASLSRALPGMATVVGWHGCDHTGPAFEQDVLSFRHTLLDATPAGSGRVFAVQVEGFAHRTAEPDHILDWTVMAAAP
ncbi:MAG: acyl dehydratase [Acidimicrobiaceae bacterium]|nr:acyl dehydratase [Acidimicrobiaceae bacterium]MYE76737.1 acyl dehydratase [Acidimicrobiaceae bacterium]MYJ41557.1 acyl dehydratase [Acidimicrobiaceae bacterium]